MNDFPENAPGPVTKQRPADYGSVRPSLGLVGPSVSPGERGMSPADSITAVYPALP